MITTMAFSDQLMNHRACPVCGSLASLVVLPLTPTPLGFALRSTREEAQNLRSYPLEVSTCSACSHCYLPFVVPPPESYTDYFFESAESPGLSGAMDTLVRRLWQDFGCRPGDLVVDIGSGDGTWLSKFHAFGAAVIGVDPSSRHAERASRRGIPTLNSYFSEPVAQKIMSENGVPRLVTANFVAANIPDLSIFFDSLGELMGDETKIAITTGYHPDQFECNMFDFVYHEHVSYFTVQDFINLSDRFNFRVLSAERSWLKGGSIHVVLDKHRSLGHGESALRTARMESWRGVDDASWFALAWSRIQDQRKRTLELLDVLNAKRILGYGMSHSTTTLTYEFALESRISALTDDATSRHGMFAPGTGFEIQAWDDIPVEEFDLVIILGWQHDSLIRGKLRQRSWSHPVLQPLPRAQLVDLKLS